MVSQHFSFKTNSNYFWHSYFNLKLDPFAFPFLSCPPCVHLAWPVFHLDNLALNAGYGTIAFYHSLAQNFIKRLFISTDNILFFLLLSLLQWLIIHSYLFYTIPNIVFYYYHQYHPHRRVMLRHSEPYWPESYKGITGSRYHKLSNVFCNVWRASRSLKVSNRLHNGSDSFL